MYCKYCRNIIDEDSVFCNKCGGQLSEQHTASQAHLSANAYHDVPITSEVSDRIKFTEFLKVLFIWMVSLVVIYLFYRYVHIPVMPCIAVYLPAFLFSSGHFTRLRSVLSALTGVAGAVLYACTVYLSIKYYPAYRTVIGMVLDGMTAISFVSAVTFLVPPLISQSHVSAKKGV